MVDKKTARKMMGGRINEMGNVSATNDTANSPPMRDSNAVTQEQSRWGNKEKIAAQNPNSGFAQAIRKVQDNMSDSFRRHMDYANESALKNASRGPDNQVVRGSIRDTNSVGAGMSANRAKQLIERQGAPRKKRIM